MSRKKLVEKVYEVDYLHCYNQILLDEIKSVEKRIAGQDEKIVKREEQLKRATHDEILAASIKKQTLPNKDEQPPAKSTTSPLAKSETDAVLTPLAKKSSQGPISTG